MNRHETADVESKILEIVVYLIDYLRENQGHMTDMDDVSSDLRNMGYTDNEISSAYCWVMDRYGTGDQVYFSEFPDEHHSSRVLSNAERFQFAPEAYGFLLKLLNLGLIDDEQMETVLDRGALLGPKPINQEQVKLIATTFVFSEAGELDGFPWVDIDDDDPSLLIH